MKTMVVFMIVSFFVGAKSKREITDMGKVYRKQGVLTVQLMVEILRNSDLLITA